MLLRVLEHVFRKETIAITKSKVASYKLSLEEATEITTLFMNDESMAAGDIDLCISAVNEAAKPRDVNLTLPKQKFQTFMMAEHFLTEEHWKNISDSRMAVHS